MSIDRLFSIIAIVDRGEKMGLFRKKKMDYGYYSSYSSKRRRLRVDRAALAVIAGIFDGLTFQPLLYIFKYTPL